MQSSPRPIQVPDAFVILFIVIVLAGITTYLVTPGSFTTETVTLADGTIRTLVDADSFTLADSGPKGTPMFSGDGETSGIFNYAFDGLVSGSKWGSAVGVVAFILVVGGAFGIVMKTQAINNGILRLIAKTRGTDIVILPVMFLLFSFGGAVFGMGEEAIAFCIVLIPLVVALGYDSITALLITYVATQIGFATSWMNPFSVAIAQGIANVPLMSGQGFRIAMWALFTAFGLIFTLLYARRIKASPNASLVFESDQRHHAQQTDSKNQHAIYEWIDSAILAVFFIGIGWVIYGVVVHKYYIPQIASQFFVIGVTIGILAVLAGRLRANDVSQAFVHGAKELLPAALIVGMAKGIVLVLGGDDVTNPSVLNTLLYYTSQGMSHFSATACALLMLLFQSIFNFFVASGSGQAAITMPLMSPLSDLVGVSRQVSVLAFQLGDGLSNLIIPTSASLIGCLGVARIDWTTWIRFVWKFTLGLFTLASATIIVAVQIGLS